MIRAAVGIAASLFEIVARHEAVRYCRVPTSKISADHPRVHDLPLYYARILQERRTLL